MSKLQLQEAKDRLRAFEKRDEEKAKTDKAKNDFESIIYALRDWVSESENIQFVGSNEEVEKILEDLREAEDWLENDGYMSTFDEYNKRFLALFKHSQSFKTRKDESERRDPAVSEAKKRIESFLDKLEELGRKKAWITEDQKKDLADRITEFTQWLEESVEKQ